MSSVIAICLGACVGALSRWQLGVWLNASSASAGGMPLGTLTANLLGGYLVGICIGVFQQLPNLDPVWRLALVTGFMGALTTFSSFSAEVVAMLQQGRFVLAAATASLHLFGSLALTLLGLRTVGLLWMR